MILNFKKPWKYSQFSKGQNIKNKTFKFKSHKNISSYQTLNKMEQYYKIQQPSYKSFLTKKIHNTFKFKSYGNISSYRKLKEIKQWF